MQPRHIGGVIRLVLGLSLLTFLSCFSCSKVRLPRLFHEAGPVAQAPVTVTYAFDKAVREATVEMDVCGNNTWEGHLGQEVIKAFLDEGRARFSQVILAPPKDSPVPATNRLPDLIVNISLVRKSFQPTSSMGTSDQFMAQLDVELAATYKDGAAHPILTAPLLYSDEVSIYTPMLGSGGTQCATGQLDEAIRTAAKYLAKQTTESIFRLGSRSMPQRMATASASPTPAQVQPQFRGQRETAARLTFRATLLDGNNNQILEGGEKVGVRVDVTNQSAVPIDAASFVLTGTPSLIDAFSDALAAPPPIGPLQPGETKSTVIWGTIPVQVQAGRGELTVSLTSPSLNVSPANEVLVAAIRPGPGSSQASPIAGVTAPASPPRQTAGQAGGTGGDAPVNRFAVIVGLDRYREAFSEAHPLGSIALDAAPELLTQYGKIPENQVLILRDNRATRLDIEEALVKWLPSRIDADSIVLVYFSGLALVKPSSGTVFLVPYDATPDSSARRLISLPALQRVLGRLQARLSLLLIEALIGTLQDSSSRGPSKRSKVPNWQGILNTMKHRPQDQVRVIQIVRSGETLPNRGQLLAWLRSGTDQNRPVTVGALIRSLRSMGREAQVFPRLNPSAPEWSLPLTGQ